MAIALDTTSKRSQDAGGGSTSTWAHTCTGSNLILFVGVEIGTGKTVSGVTYNGVAMTQLNTLSLAEATFDNVYLFYKVNPATGANNIVVTASADTFIYAAAGSYTGVDQSTPIDVDGTAGPTSATSISKSLTTVKDNDWLVGFQSVGTEPDVGVYTPGANTTIRQTDASGWYTWIDTNSAQTPPGSKTMSISSDLTKTFGMSLAAIMPVQSAGTNHNAFILTGVG